uniref:(California timema) hypothetical protein n=1 Tax=Timema californicum TaxID=61474 RepID=A0A7R9JG97_TIMCA|nr:unnamed protein product [Timema californicum]
MSVNMDSRLKKQAHPKGKSEDVKSNLSTSKRGVGKTVELVPPDGGWGWAVMLGNALSNYLLCHLGCHQANMLVRDVVKSPPDGTGVGLRSVA